MPEPAAPNPAAVPPRVTVIIPTYNWSSVLSYSIGSVLRQTVADFELLVIGDCCTDDSQQIVEAIGDARVRWVNLPVNAGHQSGPNNEGLRLARGQFIAYLGHDDLWLPRHLDFALPLLESGSDLTYSITEMVPPGGGSPTFEPLELEPFVPGMWMPPSSVVHRRTSAQQVGGWRHFRDVFNDPESDLWGRIHAAGGRISFIRRLTCIKFSALQRKNVYKLRPSHEQAAWSRRIQSEPDFEAVELAQLLVPQLGELRPWQPFRQTLAEFRDDVKGRIRRRLTTAGLLRSDRVAKRRKEYQARRAFKGL